MKWTTESPKVSGFYWLRKQELTAKIVRVSVESDSVFEPGRNGPSSVSLMSYPKSERVQPFFWAGPIMSPSEFETWENDWKDRFVKSSEETLKAIAKAKKLITEQLELIEQYKELEKKNFFLEVKLAFSLPNKF